MIFKNIMLIDNNMKNNNIDNYDYNLPKELIAQQPLDKRDQSKLLVYDKKNHMIEHKKFQHIINYLNKDDIIVINETKVIKTRLYGKKETGGKVAITLIEKIENKKDLKYVYDAFLHCKNPKLGTKLIFDNGLIAEVIKTKVNGERFHIKFNNNPKQYLEQDGDYTLPGYIKNTKYKRERYQTQFANKKGSIAAPTAGLHFSQELIKKLEDKGIIFAKVCLHVGIGTFQEVRTQDYTKHKMHEEYIELDKKTANLINNRKGKLIVVGTTSLRTLESIANKKGKLKEYKGKTDLFVYPGYKFNLKFDSMITNFHLPKSTLLLLISTILGKDENDNPIWKNIYYEAIKNKYRFYSFGDAMFINNIQT